VDGGAEIPFGASTSLCASYIVPLYDECSPPTLAQAQSLCAADYNCGGVVCHSDDTTCLLRYYPLTAAVTNPGYNFYAINPQPGNNFAEYANYALYSALPNVPASSKTLCALYYNNAVEDQCAPPTLAAAQALCITDPNCGGLNCHTDNTVCTLRYFPIFLHDGDYTGYVRY